MKYDEFGVASRIGSELPNPQLTEKTSVKIFSSADTETLEDSINYFLKDSSIELVSINYVLTSNGWEKVLIVYKHWD